MFTIGKKKSKPSVDAGLNYIIRHAEENKEYKGIDQNRLALISVKKESVQRIIVSVDIEEDSDGEILVNKRKIIAQTVEEAVAFFSSYGIGAVSWLK